MTTAEACGQNPSLGFLLLLLGIKTVPWGSEAGTTVNWELLDVREDDPEEPNTCDIKSMDSLPSGKICRKVKIPLGRNKKENLEPNVELDKKRTEFLTTREENRICSSPVQSLLDLFQTSEEKSEFLGFTSYTEKNNICDVLDILEEENSNLLTMFFSSPSTSTFTGF